MFTSCKSISGKLLLLFYQIAVSRTMQSAAREVWPPTTSHLIARMRADGLALRSIQTTLCPRRRRRGVGGLDFQEHTGSLRPRAILIRQALLRALIVLALTVCPVYHWTSQRRAPSLREGVREAEMGLLGGGGGESRLSALYRAPIKGSLSVSLCGPKKGMFMV